jgi:hypothetical protein
MLIRNLLKSHSGFSTVQAIVLAGVVAAAGLVGTNLLTEQKQAIRGVEQRGNNEKFHSMIFSILKDQSYCKSSLEESLNGQTLSENVLFPIKHLNPFKSDGVNTPALVQTKGAGYTKDNKYLDNTLGVQKIELSNLKLDQEGTTYGATLSITYERLGKSLTGKTLTRNIPVKIIHEKNKFISCYAWKGAELNRLKIFCNGTGITKWNEEEKSCELKELKCEDQNAVFVGFDSGGATCKPLMDWIQLNDYIDPTRANCEKGSANAVGFVLAPDNFKVKIQCQTSGSTTGGGATGGGITGGDGGGNNNDENNQSCPLPWNPSQFIQHNATILAYSTPSVVCPTTCSSVSQIRRCNNGLLEGSGEFGFQSCFNESPNDPNCSNQSGANCNLPWGGSLPHGQSVQAWSQETATCPRTCSLYQGSLTCNNGNLQGAQTYTFKSCVSTTPQNPNCTTGTCTTPWGVTINVGDSFIAYQYSTTQEGPCSSFERRQCSAPNTLTGSYTNKSCAEVKNCCPKNGLMVLNCSSECGPYTASDPFAPACNANDPQCD